MPSLSTSAGGGRRRRPSSLPLAPALFSSSSTRRQLSPSALPSLVLRLQQSVCRLQLLAPHNLSFSSSTPECALLASSSASNLVLEGSVPLASKLQSSGGVQNTLLCLPAMGDYSIFSSFFFYFFAVVDVATLAIGLGGDGQERQRW